MRNKNNICFKNEIEARYIHINFEYLIKARLALCMK